MDENHLRELLSRVRDGQTDIDQALEALQKLPFIDLGYAKIDSHRTLRNSFPEVVYCEGKRLEHILGILQRLTQGAGPVLATRASPEVYRAVQAAVPGIRYEELARVMVYEPQPLPKRKGTILVVSAGTSDLPVAEEAVITAEVMGNRVERLYDVGVAGLHRLLAHIQGIQTATVLIVVAGMEGALPSVVGGLVKRPVIAVPTSIGYGASFGGLAALLGMLNSCASGVTVVNIDNGFGAGFAASLMNQLHEEGDLSCFPV
ncbi:MAG: 1-(5-phosphoribosyl)-5-amino-4-imidazole-carboxylate carboxylase [Chloroflexi bacterium RBG_16_57_11]|nr:MAG: 1-(5-phosphoribosyl)-5-amino-4-imidazole-carboxylate carboxylase [Chloroflexi bacterium RBG_16_57_11]